MTITRITKNEYTITAAEIHFRVYKVASCTEAYWLVDCGECKIYHYCDTLEEAIDYIDFIMCI